MRSHPDHSKHLPATQESGHANPSMLPLGALATGLGLLSLAGPSAWAQGTAAVQAPLAASAPAPLAAMPTIRVQGVSESTGKDSLKASTTRIGKGVQALRDVPQSLTVVTERLMDDRNLDTLKDTLKNTAGISFLAAEGGEEDIRLRGFSLQATGDIFADGVRDPAFYERDTFNNDRVELLRGSASMLFGRGSTGGAVNQVNKAPTLLTQHEVSATVGSGNYLRTTGDFNLVTGENAALRITTMTTTADNQGLLTDKHGIAPSLRWGIGEANEFQLSLYHLKNDNGINYGLPWLMPSTRLVQNSRGNWMANPARVLMPADSGSYYGLASDANQSGVSYGTFIHTHRFDDGGSLRSLYRAAGYDRDQRASTVRFTTERLPNPLAGQDEQAATITVPTAFVGNVGPGTVLTRGTQLKVQEMQTQHAQSDYSNNFTWLGRKHSIQAGVDVARERLKNYAAAATNPVKPTTTVGTPNDGASIDEVARPLRMNRRFDAKALGVYAQDLLEVTPEWKVLGGLRWDKFSGLYENPFLSALTPTALPTKADTRGRSDSLWSKRFGLLFQPDARTSFHASYGTSFNTSGDTYQYDTGSAKVGPEGSRNIELGAKLESARGDLSTRLALFHATKYNERNRDDASVNEVNYVLSGQRHAAGLEVDVAGRLTPQWEAYISYAFIPDANIDRVSAITGAQGEPVGTRPGLTPKHSGTVWTTYQFAPKWRLGGGLTARSSDSPTQVPAIKAPGYVSADAMLEWSGKDVTMKLNVSNLTDAYYADMLYRGHYIQGKPRTVQLTVNYNFF